MTEHIVLYFQSWEKTRRDEGQCGVEDYTAANKYFNSIKGLLCVEETVTVQDAKQMSKIRFKEQDKISWALNPLDYHEHLGEFTNMATRIFNSSTHQHYFVKPDGN